MKFSHNSDQGAELCSLILCHLWADVYGLVQRHTNTEVDVAVWKDLIQKAKVEASQLGAGSLIFRLVQAGNSGELSQHLPELGFNKEQNRTEYRAQLKDLPGDEGSPFQWKTATELGWSESEIAAFLIQVASGSAEESEIGDPLTYMQDWLNDPVLTYGPDCISIGMLNGTPSALVVAQINPKTKWSRISYMGLISELRSQNLGHWVHKQGFSMMKAQGGELYQGGTSAQNRAMIRLFERHGCSEHLKMEEWVCREVSR